MIRQRAQSVLAGFGQAKINMHVCQNVSRCISDMNKLTLNDSPQMIRVTPLPKVFSAVAFAKSRETNALASLENSSMEDSGVFMSVDRHSSTNKDVSECSSGNAETSSRSVDDDVMLSQVMQSDSCISPTACFNKPLLPSGVIKVNGPPPLPKSATHLPPGLLSRVTEFIQQNPKMAQDAVGQTSRTKRQCEFGVHQRKRKKAAECHSKVVSETESDSALASSCHLSLSSSELGSVHSGDGYFWDSPFLSQSDNTHDETGGKCLQHEKAHRDCEADTLDRMCRCVLCSVETERPLSGASASSTASTVFGPSDTAVLFSDTDKSDVTDDVYKKSCKKNVQQEKQTKKKKQKKKKKDTQHTEMSADIDGGETTSKRQTPNYFIAIQVANPEIHNRLRAVQEDIVSSSEQLRAALIPLATLHLTLMVMHLSDSDEQLNRAKIALDNCGMKLKDDLSARQLEFNVQGLGNFRNNVIFAKVENGQILDQLSHIAETVMATFAEECGILPVDNKGFKPHITIMKLSRSPKLRKKGVHKIEPALYESYVHTTFGRDCVHSLQLCSMFKPKDAKGYYHVAHTVPVQNYSTTAMPPGGRVTHCGPGNVEHQNDGIHNQGDKGEHAVDEGPRERGDDGGASVTFAEHLEIPMEWAFHAPDDS